jgi:hypothetical protein
MADALFHVGDVADVRVELTDARGQAGAAWDEAGGMIYTVSHPDAARVTDEDADPMNAEVEFTDLTPDGEDAYLEVSLDTRRGDAENRLTLRSQTFAVVPGEATGGRLTLTLRPVEPQA